jgi:hypothetical protein
MSPALDCRVERGPVVIRVDGAVLPPATVQPELPGSESVRLFDVVHAAVLHWSPNLMAATAGAVPGLSGDVEDGPLEDAIDALTYSFVAHGSELATPTGIDPQVVDAVTALAAKGSGAPTSTDAWTACLRESLELHDATRKQPVFRLAVDLDAGQVRVSA